MSSVKPKKDKLFLPFVRIMALCFLSIIFFFTLSGESYAETALMVKLPKMPAGVTPRVNSVMTVEAETARLIAGAFQKKKTRQVLLRTQAVPQVVFSDLLTSDGVELTGHSHVLRPVDDKRLVVNLEMGYKGDSRVLNASGSFRKAAEVAWPPTGVDLVGVPSDGFTTEGLDISGRDVAAMVTADLSNVRCYNQKGGFDIVEVDPDSLAILQKEIDLSNSELTDPSTSLTNRYVPPSKFVAGSWSLEGTNLTVTYSLLDAGGNVLLSKSSRAPVEDFSDISTNVVKALGEAMCNQQNILKMESWGMVDFTPCHETGQFVLQFNDSMTIDCGGNGYCSGSTEFQCEAQAYQCSWYSTGTLKYQLFGHKEDNVIYLSVHGVEEDHEGTGTVCCKEGCHTVEFSNWAFSPPLPFELPYEDGAQVAINDPTVDYVFTLLLGGN